MSLKQSCFKSIIKSDLKRSWWISALATIIIFMSSTSQLFNYSNTNYYYFGKFETALDFVENTFGNHVIGMIVSAFVVLYLFTYINKVNSVSFFHSLPTTRNSLLAAHLTSSFILVVSPMLINTIISFFTIGRGIKASWILVSFALYLVYCLVILSVTLFVVMLTGVSLASGIFTIVLVFLPLFIFMFVSELCSDYLYGFAGVDVFEEFLLKYIYLAPEKLMSASVIIYVCLTVVLFALCFFIYNKRHLENYGEVIAFPNLKGLFKVLFAICSGVLSYYYFESFWGISSILTMFVFGILGVIIANMLANKKITLKGVLRPLLVTVASILLLFVAFFFDIFGFEKRIPDIDDIEYVDISGLYWEDYEYVQSDIFDQGSVRVNKKDPYIPHFKSKEEVQLFLDLHKYAVDHQKENDDWDDDIITPSYRITERRSFDFEYTLKNGKKMQRSYYLPVAEMEALTSKIYSTDTYRKWKYPVLDGTEKIYKSVGIRDVRTYYNDDYIRISAQEENAKRIIEAVTKDRENIMYDRMQTNDYGTVMTVELNYTLTYVSDEGKEHQIEHSDNYAISKYDVNTWALLEELNLFGDNRMIESDDISGIDVYVEEFITVDDVDYFDTAATGDNYEITSAAQIESVVYETKSRVDYNSRAHGFTKREDIEAIYDLYMNYHSDVLKKGKTYAFLSIHLHFVDEHARYRQIIIPLDELPENLSHIRDQYHNSIFR